MLIAHFPAGYCFGHLFDERSKRFTFIAGSVLPDLDLLYFYTLGQRAVVHHEYMTHTPTFWLVCFTFFSALFPRRFAFIMCLFSGVLLHLCLDSVTGSIRWLYPFYDFSVTLFEIPNVYGHWIKNFVFHWTFAIELGFCFLAMILFFRKNQFRKHSLKAK